MRTSTSRLGAESDLYKTLKKLPEPEEPIVVAVYKFKDQTGQYKDTETGSSWSTAITQGATSILLRTLEESQWFIPIEREGLNNLLNERKIIRSSRGGYETQNGDQPLIPPLLFGGILLEGGVISFDSNLMTGGAGARYFGLGSSGQYRVDRITVYLRAISTSNGRILKTVYTSKTILSQQIDVGIFRYVAFQRILEAETGFTYNEPAEMAVREAIEKAVYSLIIEGAIDGLWNFNNDSIRSQSAIATYLKEKEENELTDIFGSKAQSNQSRLSIGVRANVWNYDGDYQSQLFPSVSTDVEWRFKKPFALNLAFGYGTLGSKEHYQGEIGLSELTIKKHWFPQQSSTPYFRAGLGNIVEIDNNVLNEADQLDKAHLFVIGALGYEHLFSKNLAIQAELNYRYLLDDNLDKTIHGNYNDAFWELGVGAKYYFNQRKNKQKKTREKITKPKSP